MRWIGTRNLVLILIALLISGSIAGVFVFERAWDNPGQQTLSSTGILEYQGANLKYVITCTCPKHLIFGQTARLFFTISSATQQSISPVHPEANASGATQPAKSGNDQTGVKFWYWFSDADTGWLRFPDGGSSEYLTADVKPFPDQPISVDLTVKKLSVDTLTFNIGIAAPKTNWLGDPLSTTNLVIPARAKFIQANSSYIYAISIFVTASSLVFFVDARMRAAKTKREQKLAHAHQLAAENPKQAQYAWNLARARLEDYIDQNSKQVPLVFWLAVIVTIAGFGVVVWGVSASFLPGRTTVPVVSEQGQQSGAAAQQKSVPGGTPSGSLIATGAGLITQFLGATFLVIYKSTIQQAEDFVLVLDRINNVGMAMQVLDQMPDDAPELKNDVRAKIITQLLSAGPAFGKDKPAG